MYYYFPAPPQIGKAVVLLQIAVRLMVEKAIETDVMVLVPKETRKRLAGLPAGSW
jgi:hypothetical protein